MASSIRTALYSALTSDADLLELLADPLGEEPSVYHQQAPLAAMFPYVIFAKQDGRPSWAFAGDPMQADLWLVKAICEGESASAAETIAGRVDEVLNDAPLTIAGAETLFVRRQSDVDYAEPGEGSDLFHHVGAIYRLVTRRS